MSLPSPRPSGRIEHSLHNESSNRSNSHLVFRWSAHSPRFEIRAVEREYSNDVCEEEDESTGDHAEGNGCDQEDNGPEPDDARECDGPGPELPPQDPDPSPERDDGRESAQERMARTEGIPMRPQHRDQDRGNPGGRRGHGSSSSTFRDSGEDREDRNDDPREKDRPERRGLQRSERDRFRKEDKPAEKQAEANEPSDESFFGRTQRSPIRMEWIRLEPHTMNECVYGAPDRRRRRRTATYADTTAIAPSTSMRRPKSRAEIPRGPCGFAPP